MQAGVSDGKHTAGAWMKHGKEAAGYYTAAPTARFDREHFDMSVQLAQGPAPPVLCFFPASHKTHPIAVIDIDNLEYLDRAVEVFGDTPVRVRTKNGWHLYYRSHPKQKVTSRSRIYGPKTVDCKAWGGLVLAPGSKDMRYKPHLYGEEVSLEEFWAYDFANLLPFCIKTYNLEYEKGRESRRRSHEEMRNDPKNRGRFLSADRLYVRPDREGWYDMGAISADITVDDVPLLELPNEARIANPLSSIPNRTVSVFSGWMFDWATNEKWRLVPKKELRYWSYTEQLGLLGQLRTLDVAITVLPSTGYLKDIPLEPGVVTVLIAPHGVGKTEIASQASKVHRAALTVANTISLVESNCTRFPECVSYQDKTAVASAQVWSSTLNSAEQTATGRRLEFLHLDEADACLAFLFSSLIRADPAMSWLSRQVIETPRVLVTGADIDADCVKVIKRWSEKKVHVYVRRPKEAARSISVVTQAQVTNAFYAALSNHAPGQRIAVCVDSRRWPQEVSEGISELFPDLRVGYVSGENSRTNSVARNLNSYTENLDVFIISPSIPSGASITTPFTRVFVVNTQTLLQTEVLCQMPMRFRNVEDTTIVWGMKNRNGSTTVIADEAFIRQEMQDRADRSIRRTGISQQLVDDPVLGKAFIFVTRRTRLTQSNPLGRLEEVARGHGWNYTEADLDDLVTPHGFREIKTQGKEKRANKRRVRLTKAECIDANEYERLSKLHRMTPEEKASLDLFKLRLMFGEEHPAEILADLPENWSDKVRAYCYASLDVEGRRRLEQHEMRFKSIAGAQRPIHTYDKHVIRHAILTEFDPEVPKSVAEVEFLVSKLKDSYAEVVGTVRANSNGVKFISSIIGSIGYKKDKKQTRVNDERVIMHWWDGSMVKRWSEKYQQRIQFLIARTLPF